jgi:hypothetical protein
LWDKLQLVWPILDYGARQAGAQPVNTWVTPNRATTPKFCEGQKEINVE